jgi:sterol desaturase/sphingolipid hydroxylase (fatty acid hydroxylase superfamily)
MAVQTHSSGDRVAARYARRVLGRITAAFVLAAVVFWGLEGLWPAPKGRPRDARAWRTDLTYWLFGPLVTKAVGRGGILLVVVVAAQLTGVEVSAETGIGPLVDGRWFSDLSLGAQTLLVLVVTDFTGYWLHRLFHRGRLWPFHAVHHSSERLDWLAAARVHPVNELLTRVAQAAMLLALGFDVRVVGAVVPLFSIHALFIHSALPWDFGPLRYVLSSPSFHRWHHTSQSEGLDKNFAGLFPIWDLLFGTFYMPQGRMPEVFGVHDDVPPGLWAQLWWPFRAGAD